MLRWMWNEGRYAVDEMVKKWNWTTCDGQIEWLLKLSLKLAE